MSHIGLENIPTKRLQTTNTVLDTDLIPIFTDQNSKPKLASVSNFNSGGILDSNNTFSGTNNFTSTFSLGGVAVTSSAAELNALDITAAGTAQASKAVVLDASSKIDVLDITAPKINGVSVSSTAAEIDLQCDLSAQLETVAAAGAISVTKRNTNLALVGAGAVTLAAPDASMRGQVKTIIMTADNGDVTLALTNVAGQSSGTTATFNDVSDALMLVGGITKWHVVGESGITLS